MLKHRFEKHACKVDSDDLDREPWQVGLDSVGETLKRDSSSFYEVREDGDAGGARFEDRPAKVAPEVSIGTNFR